MTEEKDSFCELIESALNDETSGRRLPADFDRRLICGIRSSGNRNPAGLCRWGGKAAALAAVASFSVLAAWIGGRFD